MLPRIVLLLIQIAAAWFLADPIKSVLPTLIARPYDIFVYAVLYTIIVFVIGFAGSLVLKNVRVPTTGTFIVALLLAFVGAGITLIEAIRVPIDTALPLLRSNHKVYALVGALIGYIIKR
ncbi:MAG: hypothetical protein SFW09_10535 [Hyphomicrobiaceae bacterium]|nr:hypothetical protein [Hyphomicrobiaceae bacterium]